MKLKNLAGALLALAGIVFCGTASAVGNGNVYEFRPITPVNTADTAFGAAQKIEFLMRLISPDPKATPIWNRPEIVFFYRSDYDTDGTPIPPLDPTSHAATLASLWQRSPLRLGIIVSGQKVYCDLTDPIAVQSRQFFDITCSYVTKFGDLALPVRLAMEDSSYVFENGGLWGIGYVGTDGKMHEITPSRFENPTDPTDPQYGVYGPDMPRNGSYDLMWGFGEDTGASKAYFIKTVGFDSKSVTDADGTWWRTVNEGRTTYKPDVPTIVIDDLPEKPEDLYLYVWSEDDTAVTMKVTDDLAVLKTKYNVEKMTFLGKDHELHDFWVKRIKIDGNNTEYAFDMKGVTRGKPATLVLKAEPGYTFHETTTAHDLIVDYLTAEVKCSDPLPPTVMVKVSPEDTVGVRPMTEVQTRVATLTVELSDPYPDGDVTVDVGPFLAVNGVAGESATNYFGISEKTETMSYLDKVDSVTFARGDMASGQLTKTLYVYAWGADAKTYAVDKAVAFVPSIEDETVRAFFVGGFEQALLKIKPIKPEIVEPVEGRLIEVNCSVPYSLRIVVNDTYNDMRSTNGFEVLVKHDITQDDSPAPYNDGFISLGRFAPDADGVLYSIPTGKTDTAKLPQVTWENTATEHAMIYLRSPESKEKSEERTIDLVVKPARQIQITATDGREGNQYVEGEDVSVDVELLNAKNDTGDTIYAFLLPQGEATNAVSATWLAQPGCTGRPIPKNGYLASGLLTLLDGTQESKRGATYDFKVELRTKQSYSAGVPVPGYESLTLTVFSQNVIPSVDYVEMNNGNDTVYASGDTFELVVPEGVTNWFQAFVTEPGEYDKTTGAAGKRFETRWRVTDPTMGTETISLFGDPDTNKFGYAFTAGKAKVEIDLKDKDMTRYGDGELNKRFTFYVNVIDNPTITVGTTKGSNQFDETESEEAGGEAALTVDLALNPVRDPLVIELTMTPPGAAGENPGKLLLRTNSTDCVQTAENTYRLIFNRGVKTKTISVKTLDGTALSRSTGFRFETKVLGAMKADGTIDTEYPYPGVPGMTCAKYYVGLPTIIKVNNVKPQYEPGDIYPEPGSTNKCAIGAGRAISWNFTDVLQDFTDNGAVGITITVRGGTEDGKDWVTNVTTQAGAAGSFTPVFTDSGVQTVSLTIKDKDGGSIDFMWYYDVEVSKKLVLTPHGPTGGKGGANATRYSTAPGLGEGHVYGGEPSAASGFESTYNCQLAKRWTVWGFGYKVGAYDDGTLDGGKDFALDGNGALIKADTIKKEDCYRYPGYFDKNGNLADSFRYTWLQILSGEDTAGFSDAILNSAFSPEQAALAADAGQPVALPTELLDDNTYDDAMLEAVFSVEYLASDNMGDINQDRIPDLYVNRYGLGVVDTVTKQVTGDDLKAITLSNNGNTDEDFLPGDPTAFAGFVSGLEAMQKPFTADYEIRGFGEALNDAPIQIGLKGVKPDRVYEDPDLSPTSTLSKVEFLAWSEFKAAYEAKNGEGTATVEMWSPERPTDPMEPDTDDDGFTDGYEYYFWYLAHVGYIDANGIHRYLTGRAYDPRNPGEGKFIPSERIAEIMDPQIKYTGSDAEERDTDNDGLPDKLEFEIGTNPFDFDSDGDGLPDGWEIMIGGTDPLLPGSSADALADGERNYDGDAMAISSYALEKTQKPVSFDIEHAKFTTFAVIKDDGDTDGVQWYAVKGAPEDVLLTTATNGAAGWSFKLEGDDRDYVWYGEKLPVTADGKRLAVSLEKGRGASGAYVSTKPVEVVTNGIVQVENPENPGEMIDQDGLITNKLAGALYPVRLAAGTLIKSVLEKPVDIEVQSLTSNIEAKVAFACWIYGKGPKNASYGEVAETAADYGCLALARPLAAAQGAQVVALPADTRDVAFLHYLVYQEFGFDPRTAWCAKDPVHPRWGKTTSDGQASEGVTVLKQGGYTGAPARTREYRAYDEFLVYSFFLNNGCDMTGFTTADAKAPYLGQVWMAFCTNPRGPNEPEWVSDEHYTGWTAMSLNGTNGADTDGDGVPDGWELYIMAGPKNKNGSYVYAPPYAGFAGAPSGAAGKLEQSYFSPFLDFAKKQQTNNQIYLGGQANDDGLNEFREFEGTDSTGWYANVQDGNATPFSTTVVHDGEWTWFNKFFPTNPWNIDTDGDGLSDAAEKAAFAYGTPADDGKLWSIPGGGLNPCSVDTDLDGLPDGWENQFKGKTVYADDAEPKPFRAKDATGAEVGNPLEGLTDGMDGTVPDAYNVVNGDSSAGSSGSTTWTVIESDGRRWSGHVDRDYDHDGLENWQEYLVGTMRCWRYDDPVSPWTAFDESVYFDEFGIFDAVRSAEILGIGGDSDEEKAAAFWYETLVNAQGQFYNPHFITGMSPAAQYFSRVTNVWDTAYLDSTLGGVDGAYYYFKDRVGGNKIEDTWSKILPLPDGSRTAPSKYISCSPIDSDTDCDGMDDYYELFHGMNPLLGASGVKADTGNACDIVFDAWRITSALEAYGSGDTKNYWQRNPWKKPRGTNGMDFEVFPYLNGLWEADPDGDNDRNGVEFLSTREKDIGSHTDPTPLWMTDSSYSNSLTRLHYRIPTRANPVVPFGEGFTYNDVEYKFSQFDGWGPCGLVMGYMPFNLDSYWSVTAEDEPNWMFSFEENEGFDTDHDALGDREERDGLYRAATDPLDADSPRRRQAMYFQGPSKPSALQTMPEVCEEYPVATKDWPTDPSFLNFTVECWAKPEDPARDQTVVERAIWTDPSNPGDQEYLRRNFQIALRGGKWMAKYDSGTLTNDEVKAFSREPAEAKWTHLAATFDGSEFRLYVDGVCQNGDTCGVKTIPENGVSAYAFVKSAAEGSTKRPGDYAWDVKYECKAILVGASFKGSSEGGKPEALDVTSALGWDYYRDFFQGYVDEIRIWDGARTSKEIGDDMLKRYTAADAKANRDAFYGQWANGEDRYAKATTVRVVPELRYHFHFDSVPGAADADSVMKAPTGFQNAGGKPVLSRPLGYAIDWFATVAGGYGTVYGPDCDWVQWIPNTVAHLPRYDGTTLDSFFWSEEYTGKSADDNKFERSAEPISRWTQMKYNGADRSSLYKTTPMRHHFVYEVQNASSNGMSAVSRDRLLTGYRFAGRHLNQMGDDLLPLGGAFVKYAPDLWDGQGPSSQWEHTGDDTSANMLPDWYEEYVRRTYGLEGGIEPDTDVTAFGRLMKVRDLYLRDLARGIVLTADGKTGEFDPARVQIADEDANGVPDWWADFYRVDGESGLDDHDNDGLPNYVEYLLSEVFDFEVLFDPTVADSVQPGIPDYFYRVGELYVGEIFTDHDLVDDSWEDLFDVKYASRLAWDADADADDDGWSNRSECRSHYWGAGFFPDIIDTFVGGSIDNQLRCFPQPAIRLKVSYNGHHDPKWSSLIVKAWRTGEYNYAANFKVDSLKKAATSTQGGKEKTQVLGIYSGRPVMRGYLHPGLLDPSSVKFQKAKISSEYTYYWHCTECTPPEHVGSYAEYKADIDRHGEAKTDPNHLGVTLNDTELTWDTFVAAYGGSDGQHGAFYFQDGDAGEGGTVEVGTINYRTGEYSLNLDLLKEKFGCDFDGMAFKASFSYSLGEYWPQTVYLSYPEDRYVREGKNNLEAFFDLNGDGVWQVGEPYGIVRDVDVSWEGATAAIELTDLSPVTPRIVFGGDSGSGSGSGSGSASGSGSGSGSGSASGSGSGSGESSGGELTDRAETVSEILQGIRSRAISQSDCKWIDNNRITPASIIGDSFRGQRIRVVRWLVNDVPVHRAGTDARVVLDKKIETDVRDVLTEADFLVGNEAFDLDWDNLSREVINNWGTIDALGGEQVRRVCYLIVVGDGATGWAVDSSTNEVVALSSVITRYYGETRVTPVAIAPGAAKEETVHSANPTFKWKMDCPEEEGYTAFSVQVLDGTKVIWDSDKQLAPPRNIDGEYVWEAPLYVGDKTQKGEVFKDKKVYTWQVAMYNAKFSNAANYSKAGRFLMEVQTNGYKYGSANVAVRYFGPKSSYKKNDSTIRVRAYTSPDFTGLPVAAGYVADTDSVTNVTVDAANCTVIGIPEGTYYLQAFIDSDGNGVCDPWETQGYLCSRSQKEPIAEYLDPTAITFDSKVGTGDLAIIYLEDADIDGDGLPDAWEYAEFGSIEAKGVEKLTETKAGEFVANVDLSAAIAKPLKGKAPTAGLEGEIRNTMAKLRSPAGVSAATGIDPADVEVTDGGLEVKSEIDPETLTIVGFAVDTAQNRVLLKVGAETTADINPTVANFLNITVRKGAEVTVKVEHAESPNGPWTEVPDVGGTVTVDKAGADIEVNLNGKLPAQGYFRAKVEEK